MKKGRNVVVIGGNNSGISTLGYLTLKQCAKRGLTIQTLDWGALLYTSSMVGTNYHYDYYVELEKINSSNALFIDNINSNLPSYQKRKHSFKTSERSFTSTSSDTLASSSIQFMCDCISTRKKGNKITIFGFTGDPEFPENKIKEFMGSRFIDLIFESTFCSKILLPVPYYGQNKQSE